MEVLDVSGPWITFFDRGARSDASASSMVYVVWWGAARA